MKGQPHSDIRSA